MSKSVSRVLCTNKKTTAKVRLKKLPEMAVFYVSKSISRVLCTNKKTTAAVRLKKLPEMAVF